MTAKLQVNEQAGVFHLKGSMDQSSDFSPLLKAGEPLVLNLAGVDQINSLGIQKFMTFLKDWGSKKLEYRQCSVPFLLAASMIPAMVKPPVDGAAIRIKSLYCPYRCGACKKTSDVLIDVSKIREGADGFLPPEDPGSCQHCGKAELAFDDEPEQYFQFMKV